MPGGQKRVREKTASGIPPDIRRLSAEKNSMRKLGDVKL